MNYTKPCAEAVAIEFVNIIMTSNGNLSYDDCYIFHSPNETSTPVVDMPTPDF